VGLDRLDLVPNRFRQLFEQLADVAQGAELSRFVRIGREADAVNELLIAHDNPPVLLAAERRMRGSSHPLTSGVNRRGAS
jgi:hypothetical protein